uniref:Peptidase S1 domain-containing protein n=1 Tax=Clastoptera arizonana TaxID=38151 RepID=A0A1B6E420_9HEMI
MVSTSMKSVIVLFVLLKVSASSVWGAPQEALPERYDEPAHEDPATESRVDPILKTLPPSPPSEMGHETTILKHPYQCALFISRRFAGSCTIISEDFALATSVYLFGVFPFDVTLKIGATNVNKDGTLVYINDFYTHPDYEYTADNDIVLLQFDRKISFSKTIQPIGLALTSPPPGESVSLSGWGEGIANNSWALHETELKIIDQDVCNATTNGEATEKIICAGSDRVFVCDHDIGDPIVYNNTLVGMYVGGYSVCRNDNIIYTRISSYHEYLKNLIKKVRKGAFEEKSSE